MSESRSTGGETSRRPPEPDQLGQVRDLIKALTPSPEETEAKRRAGSLVPNVRSHEFTKDDGSLVEVHVTSFAHVPSDEDSNAVGRASVRHFTETRGMMLSQRVFDLGAEGDPEVNENLHLDCIQTQTNFDNRGFTNSVMNSLVGGSTDFMEDYIADMRPRLESALIGQELRANGANADQAQDLIDTLVAARDTGTILER
jgi:hypothetical protein